MVVLRNSKLFLCYMALQLIGSQMPPTQKAFKQLKINTLHSTKDTLIHFDFNFPALIFVVDESLFKIKQLY